MKRNFARETSLEVLAAEASEGEMDSLEQLLCRIHGYLKSQLFLLGVNSSDIDDVAQEVAMRMYKSLLNYDKRKPFLPWFRGVIRYSALDYQRKMAREAHNKSAFREYITNAYREKYSTVADEFLTTDNDRLKHCLQNLPDNHRKVVILRYEASMNSSEIANELDMKPSSVRQMLTRIRAALRVCLGGHTKNISSSTDRM